MILQMLFLKSRFLTIVIGSMTVMPFMTLLPLRLSLCQGPHSPAQPQGGIPDGSDQ